MATKTEKTNLRFWDAFKTPPEAVLKAFDNGSFHGTDINPQWRLQALTELFGPVGIGWKYEIVEHWTETEAQTNESTAWVVISLSYKTEEGWSEGIPGIGGYKMVRGTKSGFKHNDEAYKGAFTDAISVACKAIGIGADVYFGSFEGSKYTGKGQPDVNPGGKNIEDDTLPPDMQTLSEQQIKTLVTTLKTAGITPEQFKVYRMKLEKQLFKTESESLAAVPSKLFTPLMRVIKENAQAIKDAYAESQIGGY